MDINQKIQEAIGTIDFEEIAVSAAKEQIEKAVKAAVNEQFRSYSDFSKGLEKHIAGEIGIDFSAIKLPEYREFLIKEVNNSLASFVSEKGKDDISKYINSMVVGETRDEIEFDKFFDELCEMVSETCDEGEFEKYRIEVIDSEWSWSKGKTLKIFLGDEDRKEIIHAGLSEDDVYYVRADDSYELSRVATWLQALQFRKTKILNLRRDSALIPEYD